MGEAK